MDPTLVLQGIRYGREHVKPRIDSWLPATAPDNPPPSRPLERAKQRAQDYMATHMCALVFQPRPQMRAPLCSRLIRLDWRVALDREGGAGSGEITLERQTRRAQLRPGKSSARTKVGGKYSFAEFVSKVY